MMKTKTIFWISTALVAGQMLFSAYMVFQVKMMRDSLDHLGFPRYFQIELAIAKIAGAIAILLPNIPSRIKEWAYFGFFIMFASGIFSHIISGDPATVWGVGIFALCLLLTSYFSYLKL